MTRRTWIENSFCHDGTELIIFWNNGTYEVSEYDFSDEGAVVFTGTYEKCKAFVETRWHEIAAACIF